MAVNNRTTQVTVYTSPYGIIGPAGAQGVTGPTGPGSLTGDAASAFYNLELGVLGATVSNTLEFLIQALNIDLGTIPNPNSVSFDGGNFTGTGINVL